jgi:HAD superfamily hydrolase (TIGR01509 family)
MVERGSGTILLTGATASLKGSARFAGLAVGKIGLRALAQSLARELSSQGIHVAHIVIDGLLNTPRVQAMAPQQEQHTLLAPEAIAQTYWQLYQQDATAWTLELDLRPALSEILATRYSKRLLCRGQKVEGLLFEAPADLDKFIAELHAVKTKYYQQLVAEGGIPLRLGVERLLNEARQQQMRLAIATTAALPNVIALLEHTLGSDSPFWFEVIAAGDIVPAKKPAPDIYQYVLRFMNLEAQDCFAIEDSHHGLTAASKAGLKTVITVNEYTQEEEFSRAILVLNHLGEPEQPFSVLAGDAGDSSYMDMSLVHRLHRNGRTGI